MLFDAEMTHFSFKCEFQGTQQLNIVGFNPKLYIQVQ